MERKGEKEERDNISIMNRVKGGLIRVSTLLIN